MKAIPSVPLQTCSDPSVSEEIRQNLKKMDLKTVKSQLQGIFQDFENFIGQGEEEEVEQGELESEMGEEEKEEVERKRKVEMEVFKRCEEVNWG